MSNVYLPTPPGFFTREEVEELLGVSYQTFRKELLPDNFDYTGWSGHPRNLYRKESVEKYQKEHFDENGKHIPSKHVHNFQKDKYTGHDVRLKLGDEYYEILKKKLPIMEVKEGKRIVNYYNKRLIDTIARLRFSPDLLKVFVNNAKEVQFEYSGRFMYGAICIGFVTEKASDFMRRVIRDCDEMTMIEFHNHIFDYEYDEMGLDQIVYIKNSYRFN